MCALQEVRCSDLDAVRNAFRACHARAVGAAVKRATRLDAVSDHLDVAVLAGWGERVDRTLEAVEGVRVPTGHRDGDRLVVVVAADFTLGHSSTPFRRFS